MKSYIIIIVLHLDYFRKVLDVSHEHTTQNESTGAATDLTQPEHLPRAASRLLPAQATPKTKDFRDI